MIGGGGGRGCLLRERSSYQLASLHRLAQGLLRACPLSFPPSRFRLPGRVQQILDARHRGAPCQCLRIRSALGTFRHIFNTILSERPTSLFCFSKHVCVTCFFLDCGDFARKETSLKGAGAARGGAEVRWDGERCSMRAVPGVHNHRQGRERRERASDLPPPLFLPQPPSTPTGALQGARRRINQMRRWMSEAWP